MEGRATISLIQFDTVDPFEVVYQTVDITNVPPVTHATFEPRGGTQLLDAIGRTIVTLERELAAMPASGRPGKVIVVITTDGQENASSRYTAEKICSMITVKEELLGWHFVFLSSDINAVHDSHHQGIMASKSMRFRSDRVGDT